MKFFFRIVGLCCLLWPLNGLGQQIYNQWINFNQAYYKVGVRETGMHRISYQQLVDAGIPINAVDPTTLSMYFRGQEIAIKVTGEEDGVFNSTDYITFYGERNTGWIDNFMYTDPDNRTNPYVSIYSDINYYFLTYSLDGSPGRRILERDYSNEPAAPQSWHWHTEVLSYANGFTTGPLYPRFFQSVTDQGALLSDFSRGGKGFIHTASGGNTLRYYDFNIRNYAASTGARPRLTTRMAGRSNTPHQVDWLINPASGGQRVLQRMEFSDYEAVTYQGTLNASDLPTNGVLQVGYQINQVSSSFNEIVAASFLELQYPQLTDAGSAPAKTFTFPNRFGSILRATFQNAPENARWYDITNQSNIEELTPVETLEGVAVQFANRATESKIFMSSEIKSVVGITATEMSPLNGIGVEYLMVTHRSLREPGGNYSDPVLAYAEYRSSAAGGNHSVLLANVDNLYNQFTFGEPHPLAIKRLVEWAASRSSNLEYLFLIGKGLAYFHYYGYNLPNSEQWTYRNLVPCYGEPCSDNAYSMETDGRYSIPQLATGRLSALSPSEVAAYLEKVIAHEATPHTVPWKKRILHLSGGRNPDEHNLLASSLQNIAFYPEGPYLGASITALSKRTTEEVEFIDVTDEVNEGVSMITFFGHSSLRATDFEIGYVSNEIHGFENEGKLPFLFMMGCDAGHAFARTRSFGEDWILTPKKGAIGFWGHSHLGFVTPQRQLSTKFYETVFPDSTLIFQPLGKQVQAAFQEMLNAGPNDEMVITTLQQFNLSADPAVRLFNLRKPDYNITEQHLQASSFDPVSPLSIESDSIRLRIALENLGLTHSGTVSISVSRRFEDGTLVQYPSFEVPPVAYQDTVFFTVPVTEAEKAISGGTSFLIVEIDQPQQIEEENEQNNRAELRLVLPNSRLLLISPRDFAIVNRQRVELLAQDAATNSEGKTFRFQLDTVPNFNSAYLQETAVSTDDGLPRWQTELLPPQPGDSIVYYWRAREQNTESDTTAWRSRSFIHLQESPTGWSQTAVPQFEQDLLENLLVTAGPTWSLPSDTVRVQAHTSGFFADNRSDFGIRYDGTQAVRPGECGLNFLLLIAFDRETGRPYLPSNETWNYCGFGNPGVAFRIYDSQLRGPGNLQRYLDGVQPGDPVLIVGVGRIRYDAFSNELVEQFARIGCDPINLRRLSNDEAYIAFGSKDAPEGTAQEVLPRYTAPEPPNTQRIEGEFFFLKDNLSGSATSVQIGPANEWESVFLDYKSAFPEDLQVDLFGLDLQGNAFLLQSALPDGLSDISSIDPTIYPYLRLRATFGRATGRRFAQLRDWKVLFREVPEGFLSPQPDPETHFAATIAEGDSAVFRYSFQNISTTDFAEPLVVAYTLTTGNGEQQVSFDTLTNLSASDSILFEKAIPTVGKAGENQLSTYVNPRLQPEQEYTNNISNTTFTVQPDTIHPILEVTFDGRRIMDGELVSPEPLIAISVKDENQFLTKQDTLGIDLFLQSCDSCMFNRVPLASPAVDWATTEDGRFQLHYRPGPLQDGQYALRAQAADAVGNLSGSGPYQVRFTVENRSAITHFYPYPNPFSDRVRFVFTLTGATLPQNFKIQIMTVTGRVVREIMMDELGPIRIGHNITEYAWDGRDEYGDQLANGVYLYRVVMEGFEGEHRETSGDDLFDKGFGKMYLMR